MENQSVAIKSFIIKNLPEHNSDIISLVTNHFKVTRTTAHRHLNNLIKDGKIVKTGATRNTRYYLQGKYERVREYSLSNKISEDHIFYEDFADIFKSLKPNIYKICSFGVTEMINNALDHSQGTSIILSTKFVDPYLTINIKDNGIGAFKKICTFLHIDDLREGILQISKGKITTDSVNHSGQGIFFTSRMFDEFSLSANGYKYSRFNIQDDWTFNDDDVTVGTEVELTINIVSGRNIVHVFEKYQGDGFEFDRTEIMVDLAKYNEDTLVSRSQAKRILFGLEKFSIINLNFRRIDFVGQGFVDEIFRVFVNANPNIQIKYINANADVTFMIERGVTKK